MKKLFFVILVLSGPYAYGGDAIEPTEDKDVTWFRQHYGGFTFIFDTKTPENHKQTVLLVHECRKHNPSTEKMNKYIKNGALLNAEVNKFRQKTTKSRYLDDDDGISLGTPLEAAITHVEDTKVVNVCQLLINAKANPVLSPEPKCPLVRTVVKRFEKFSQSPTSLKICAILITLTEPHERVNGMFVGQRAVDYAIEEIDHPSVNSKALLPFLKEHAKKQPTQKSDDILKIFQQSGKSPATKPATEEKRYDFSNAPESEQTEMQSPPNQANSCTIL
jgi:hypothetical protein